MSCHSEFFTCLRHIDNIAAMRAARDNARAELVTARKELHDACSQRQEAVLITLGVLE